MVAIGPTAISTKGFFIFLFRSQVPITQKNPKVGAILLHAMAAPINKEIEIVSIRELRIWSPISRKPGNLSIPLAVAPKAWTSIHIQTAPAIKATSGYPFNNKPIAKIKVVPAMP